MAEGAAEACAAKKATVVVARRVLKNMLKSVGYETEEFEVEE
jgi:hypothetical protein